MANVNFKTKQVTKKLLTPLQSRTKDVISNRFGLEEVERKTLEAIGQKYGITRERVRQIENFAINTIKKSDAYKEHKDVFGEIQSIMHKLGGIIGEKELLNHFSKDEIAQNHIHFYLVLGDQFTKHKEDANFDHRWSVDDNVTEKVHSSIKKLYSSLSDSELIDEDKLIDEFVSHLGEIEEQYNKKEIIRSWLALSKLIGKNQLDQWGKSDSPQIKTRGIKDYAYLVLKKRMSPMHFREVAKEINKLFDKKAHIATTHNELIKDDRFVLVGRGLYGLKEWGHTAGVVHEVIAEVIKESGKKSLDKDTIVEAVMKKRSVKVNTILVNLQNEKYFKKMKDGTYSVA
jgi:DNA-directed RNA polymerase delta subunit